MALTFYTNPMSRGRIVRWMLEEVGAPYDTVLVDWQDKGGLLDVNPLGKVPTIVHDGKTVTEAAAICAYLADAFPEAGVAPALDDRADYYRWLFFAAGPTEAATTDRALGVEVPQDKRMMVGYGSLDEMIDTLEGAVSGRDYITGDTFTAADVYVGSQIGWGTMFGSIPKREAFTTYLERLHARPAYKRASEIDDTLIAAAKTED